MRFQIWFYLWLVPSINASFLLHGIVHISFYVQCEFGWHVLDSLIFCENFSSSPYSKPMQLGLKDFFGHEFQSRHADLVQRQFLSFSFIQLLDFHSHNMQIEVQEWKIFFYSIMILPQNFKNSFIRSSFVLPFDGGDDKFQLQWIFGLYLSWSRVHIWRCFSLYDQSVQNLNVY